MRLARAWPGSGSGVALGSGAGAAVGCGRRRGGGSAPSTARRRRRRRPRSCRRRSRRRRASRRTRSPSPSRFTVTRAPPDDQLRSPLPSPCALAVHHEARDRAAVADAAVLRRRRAADALGRDEAVEERDALGGRGRAGARLPAGARRARGRAAARDLHAGPRRAVRRGVAPAVAHRGAADDPEVARGHVRDGAGTRRRLGGRRGHEQQRARARRLRARGSASASDQSDKAAVSRTAGACSRAP